MIAQLLHLESENPDAAINLYLNSPGGSVTAMLAVYDTMRFIKAPVATTAVGQAGSSAAVLLAAGEPVAGRCCRTPGSCCTSPPAAARAPCPTSRCRPRRSCGCARRWSASSAAHTGQPVERLRADTERDLVLDAEQAVAYGLADAVLDSRKAVPVG